MTRFYNPYHFVPCAKSTPGAVAIDDFEKGGPIQVTHDRWLPSTGENAVYHGRLVCCLTPETPLVIGAAQEEQKGKPTKVTPFELDGQPAIPGSSLRGLISSIAEAASNSALRVLNNSVYSYRKEMREALSALGMIRVTKSGDKEEYHLLPLALPHMVAMPGEPFKIEQSIPLDPDQRRAPAPVSLGKYTPEMFRYAALKRYFGRHCGDNDDEDNIASASFLDNYKSPKAVPGPLYKADVARVTLNGDGCIPRAIDLHCKPCDPADDVQAVVLGVTHPSVMPEAGSDDRLRNTSGIVRVLGCVMEREIPLWEPPRPGQKDKGGKKHEIFIPWPEEPIPEDAWICVNLSIIDRFHEIADTCTNADKKDTPELAARPYHLWGTDRNTSGNPKDLRFRLKSGDIVFFRPDNTGSGIAEISISSIWRGRVETILNPGHEVHPVTTWDFFAGINPDLLPAGAPTKKKLTMAELLFGFVEQCKGESSRALASRLRISNARIYANPPEGGWYLPETTLKILASPKPPSPALYFGPGHKRKNELGKTDPSGKPCAVPNGRKFYLHHGSNPNPTEWTSDPTQGAHLHMRVKPLRADKKSAPAFWFHVDFDNLTEVELGCLIYALRPTDSFRHKLGLGKPLGLGTSKIDIAGLFLVDRRERYGSDDPFAASTRYHQTWMSDLQPVPPKYKVAKASALPKEIVEFRNIFSDLMKERGLKTVLNALETLGDPAKTSNGTPVHYPQMAGHSIEGEHYRWFVQNDKGPREFLNPIGDGTIPSLTRHERPPPHRNGGGHRRDDRPQNRNWR